MSCLYRKLDYSPTSLDTGNYGIFLSDTVRYHMYNWLSANSAFYPTITCMWFWVLIEGVK